MVAAMLAFLFPVIQRSRHMTREAKDICVCLSVGRSVRLSVCLCPASIFMALAEQRAVPMLAATRYLSII